HVIKEVEGHVGWAAGPCPPAILRPAAWTSCDCFARFKTSPRSAISIPTVGSRSRPHGLPWTRSRAGRTSVKTPSSPRRVRTSAVSPVYFRNKSEPYITLAIAGSDGSVTVAEVNLKAIQDMVTATRVGDHGVAFVVDTRGRVIAHSDGGMVQRDFSDLAHVQAATLAGPIHAVQTVNGRQVIANYAIVARPTPECCGVAG